MNAQWGIWESYLTQVVCFKCPSGVVHPDSLNTRMMHVEALTLAPHQVEALRIIIKTEK